MVLIWVLFILSFAPLLMCQQPDCVNLTSTLNDTIIDQESGKWYYVASAFGYLPYRKEAQTIQSSFYYLIPNKTEDTFQGKEYNTVGDKCVYQEGEIFFNRTEGTILKIESDQQQHVGHIALTQDPNAFLILYFPNDKVFGGVSLSVRTQKASEEQLKEFQEIAKCLGFQEEELLYTDWSKDKCEPLEKEHNHNRKESQDAKDVSRAEDLS
ncbi:alpha-1-acid glycoprotein 1-like [Vombatus ursinus]|uniref:Lipocalin/cytosolic fatty-acid binding domain-containing protein n=1 Tax=Vombatus ursinus TaxID=29139 RepID=A0A4X2LLD4_VOMUR|nr:alpha-1-acid glycoprotein 1-like [Vombatus ursinus]